MWIVTVFIGMVHAGPIAKAMHVGDCAGVLEQAATSDAERLAHATCQMQKKDWDAAIDATSSIREGVLGEYARWVQAKAHIERSEPLLAHDLLLDLTLPGSLSWQVPLTRGKSLVLAGDSLRARDGLRELLKSKGGVEARYWLAKGGEDRGEKTAAIGTYRHVWANGVRGQWDEKAAERLNALGAPVPDPGSEVGLSLIRSRMGSLNKERQYAEFLALLEVIHRVNPPDTPAEIREHARAIFKARKYPESVVAFGGALGSPDRAKGTPSDLFNYALALARTGDYDNALVVYGRLIETHPKSKRADFGSFKRGYTEYDRRHLEAAITEFARHIKSRPDSKYLDEAIWFLGLCYWLQDNKTKAGETWARLPDARPSSPLVPAAKYWLARLQGIAGDSDAETRAYQDLLRDHPIAGHTWYAVHRLGHSFPKVERMVPPNWPKDLAQRKEVIRADVLLAGGFTQWARDEMQPLERIAMSKGKSARLAAAWRFIAAGDYRTGQKLARPYCVKPWRGGEPVAQQACHPMPEAPVVEQVAVAHRVNPYLPYGVMIAESALKPWVTSHAGARGLMQLMPEVGERLAKELHPDKTYHPDQLYSASFNAKLGTTELAQRTKSLNGTLNSTSLPAIIASYNGGEAAVRRWITQFEESPEFDVFAETIGYAETRRYVRRVLGYIMIYRWTYGDP